MGRDEEVIRSSDGKIQGAKVRVQPRTGMSKVLKQPIQLLYPVEICFQEESRPPFETSANAGNILHSPGQNDLQTIDQNLSARDTGIIPGGPREQHRQLAALQA